jgi:nucleoside-diphosphate-sugar epimerase
LHAPLEKIHNKPINIGANIENYQVKDVADKVQQLVPSANIVFTGEIGVDPRDYRVNFDLLYKLLPDFKLDYTLQSGMEDMYHRLKEMKFSAADFDGDRFVRLKLLQKQLSLVLPVK